MAQNMWGNAFIGEGWELLRRVGGGLGEDIFEFGPGHRASHGIEEEFGVATRRADCQPGLQRRHGLFPQGQHPFVASLTHDVDAGDRLAVNLDNRPLMRLTWRTRSFVNALRSRAMRR